MVKTLGRKKNHYKTRSNGNSRGIIKHNSNTIKLRCKKRKRCNTRKSQRGKRCRSHTNKRSRNGRKSRRNGKRVRGRKSRRGKRIHNMYGGMDAAARTSKKSYDELTKGKDLNWSVKGNGEWGKTDEKENEYGDEEDKHNSGDDVTTNSPTQKQTSAPSDVEDPALAASRHATSDDNDDDGEVATADAEDTLRTAPLTPATIDAANVNPASALLTPATIDAANVNPASALLTPATIDAANVNPASALLTPATIDDANVNPASAPLTPATIDDANVNPASGPLPGSANDKEIKELIKQVIRLKGDIDEDEAKEIRTINPTIKP